MVTKKMTIVGTFSVIVQLQTSRRFVSSSNFRSSKPQLWIDAHCTSKHEFVCEQDAVPKVVARKSSYGEWSHHGHKEDDCAVEKMLTFENKTTEDWGTFWLLPDGAKNKGFVLDFGIVKALNLVQLVNTHVTKWRDRGTKEFKVFLR